MKRLQHRIPRGQTTHVADVLAERFGLDPESVRCDFEHGTIEVRAEHLAALLAQTIDPATLDGALYYMGQK